MSVVVSILIAIAVAFALVLGSRLWFDRVQKRAHAQRIGIEALDARRWREALDLLVQALAKDGYTQAAEVTGPSGMPLAERHLSRGNSRVLLIYKHGTSYLIGSAALLDAERRRQDAEMDEVIVATLGSLDGGALAQAARMKVVCLDGPTVWSKVRDVLDTATQEAIATGSDEERRGALAKAITALPEVQRASWSSGRTMIVALQPRTGIDRGMESVCALALTYPLVSDVRLQMETAGGAEVRWRRCG